MSAYAIVTLRLASGEVVGPLSVFGAGGVYLRLRDVGRMREVVQALVDRATDGVALPCYEPEPGHCLMLRVTANGDEARRVVDLHGAVVIDVR